MTGVDKDEIKPGDMIPEDDPSGLRGLVIAAVRKGTKVLLWVLSGGKVRKHEWGDGLKPPPP